MRCVAYDKRGTHAVYISGLCYVEKRIHYTLYNAYRCSTECAPRVFIHCELCVLLLGAAEP